MSVGERFVIAHTFHMRMTAESSGNFCFYTKYGMVAKIRSNFDWYVKRRNCLVYPINLKIHLASISAANSLLGSVLRAVCCNANIVAYYLSFPFNNWNWKHVIWSIGSAICEWTYDHWISSICQSRKIVHPLINMREMSHSIYVAQLFPCFASFTRCVRAQSIVIVLQETERVAAVVVVVEGLQNECVNAKHFN